MTNSTTPLANCDWPTLTTQLNDNGYAVTPPLLSTADCLELIALYDQPDPWRARVEPDKYRLGPGEYQHFAEPLPATIAAFREECYEHLAPVANAWHDKLGMQTRFPRHLKEFLDICHLTGQTKPAPAVHRHATHDFQSLRDAPGPHHTFPLRMTIMLSKPGKDFTGGDLMLVENLPRARSRGHVIPLKQGQAAIWPGRYRPGTGVRGNIYRIEVRNGISKVHSGTRHALEVAFHDTD